MKLVWSKNKLEKLRKIGRLEEGKEDFRECNISGVKIDDFGLFNDIFYVYFRTCLNFCK